MELLVLPVQSVKSALLVLNMKKCSRYFWICFGVFSSSNENFRVVFFNPLLFEDNMSTCKSYVYCT